MISIILVLVILGVGLWLINTYIPMAPAIKQLINILAVIAVIVWLLSAIGVLRV